MVDKKLLCIDCNKGFVFTEAEQQFFEEKGYSEPIRCKDCRSKRKADKRTGGFKNS
ncbi:MAG: zinc-ribbon domain containing protein [Candidatus Methanoperedens sp.]|nr:zinc-ribbon domain containing protein [Candidatus Methanoperedens sp.]